MVHVDQVQVQNNIRMWMQKFDLTPIIERMLNIYVKLVQLCVSNSCISKMVCFIHSTLWRYNCRIYMGSLNFCYSSSNIWCWINVNSNISASICRTSTSIYNNVVIAMLDNVIQCQCVCDEVDLLNNQCYSFFILLIVSHC